ncbi:MAG: PAS domain-containing protein [Bacteroidota bacterium]
MKLSPLRIAAIYLVIALLWITTTDAMVEAMVDDATVISRIQSVKGWFYMILTAFGLYYLVNRYEKDISKEKNNLKRKDESLTLALESNKMATWEYFPEKDQYITSSNHHSFFDFPQSRELSLKDVLKRIHPDDIERFKDEVSETTNTGRDFNIEYRIVRRDGEVRWLWTRGYVHKNNGKIEKVSGITSDITESKTLSRKLDLEREKFETLFDEIPVLISVFDTDMNVTKVNREFENVLGWDPAGSQQNDLLDAFFRDEELKEEVFGHMMNPGIGWKELELVTASGEIRSQMWNSIRLSDSTIVGIGYDITERKKLETKEQKERKRLLDIFNNLPVFINIHDKEQRIEECNEFVFERLGYDKYTVEQGRLLEEMIRDKQTLVEAHRHMSKLDRSWKEFDIFTKDGERLTTTWMNMKLNESVNLGVGIDLTEIKGLEEQLSLAVKGGNVGLWDFYPNQDEILINDLWAEMLGYTREELSPLTYNRWKELTHPDDVEKTERLLDLHFKGEISSYDSEIRMKHKDGHWVWMLDRGTAAERNNHGEVTRMTGTHIDISERKKLDQKIEESQTRLRLTTNSANVGLWEWNPQTGEVRIDEVWAGLVGYTLEELQPVSIDTWNKLLHPDDHARFEKKVESYFSGELDFYEIEVRMHHKEGHWVWILDRGRNVEWNEQGEPVKMMGTHVEITNLKEKEQLLEESEHLLKESQKVANLGTYALDLNSGEVTSSRILDEMFWLPEGESISTEILRLMLHPDFEEVRDQYQRALTEKKSFEAEFKIKNPDTGEERWVYEKADIEYGGNGRADRMIGVMQDITHSKEQELQIRRTLSQFRIAEEIAEIGYWEKNLDDNTLFWGDNKYKLYGADPEEGPIQRQVFFRNVHPEDRKPTYDAYEKAESGIGLDVTYRYKKENGSYKTFREKAEVVTEDSTGKTILRGVTIDISSLKLIESQLEDERKRLKIITRIVSDVVWEWNLEYDTINWSEGMEAVFGYPLTELPDGEESWTRHIHPDDRQRVVAGVEKAIQGIDLFWEDEYRFIDSDGDTRYVLDQGYIFRDSDGTAKKIVGAIIDQTESKKTQEVLTSQAQLLEDISDAVIATDSNMQITSWNRAAEMMYGWSEQEAIGKKLAELLPTSFENADEKELFELLLDQEEWSGEVIQNNRLDEPMFILSSIRVITDRGGNFEGTVAVNKDITAIKKIQQRLSYEQRRFEYATSVISDAIWDANPNTGSVWWSEGLETHYLHEIPPPEDGFEVWKNNLHPDDREEVLNNMKHAEESGATEWHKEYRFIRGDGSEALVLDRANIVRDENGNILRIIGAMNDITLQKQAESDLKRSEQQYRLLYKQSPLPMYIYDKKTFRFLSVNDALIEKFGYTETEFLEMTIFDLFLPEEEEMIRNEARRNLEHNRSGFDMWRQVTKSGETLICEISGSDIYFKENQQRLVVTIDITQQRKAEEKAIKAVVEGEERERHRIANELHDGLGQYLSAANMHLNSVYSDVASLSDSEDRSFHTGLQMLEYAISETRSISHNLLPKAIQDYGLKLAVESLVNEMHGNGETDLYLFQKYEDDILPGNIQINMFRIIQEALNNALKHSQAKNISINLVYSDGELICTVEDNGMGFDPENIGNDGLGLQSMKTRVAAMSGNLDIESKENSGTLITAIVPLHV